MLVAKEAVDAKEAWSEWFYRVSGEALAKHNELNRAGVPKNGAERVFVISDEDMAKARSAGHYRIFGLRLVTP